MGVGVSCELAAPAGAGAVVQTAESAQAVKAAAGAEGEAQESLRASRSLRVYLALSLVKKEATQVLPSLRGAPMRVPKGVIADTQSAAPIRRESSTRSLAPRRPTRPATHAHASTSRRHNHGADRTQGADRRRAAAGASLSVPLVTRPLTHATARLLLAPLRRMMERSRSRTCSSRSCSSTASPQARPAPRSPRPAPRHE